MNSIIRILLAASAVALLAALGHATTDGKGSTRPPVPTKIVHPMHLPRSYENAVIKLVFSLDEAGVPHHVGTVEKVSPELAKHLLPAIAEWRFTPCYENGKPVRARVILPLRVVDGDIVALVEYPPVNHVPAADAIARQP